MVTWMVFASSWNKVSCYLWASVCLLAQQCWKVPVTSEADAELECWVYQCLLEPATAMPVAQVLESGKGAANWLALSSQTIEVMRSRGYIFILFTKKTSLPPPKYHCKSILWPPWRWYIFFLFFWGGGGGGPKHHCFLIKYLQLFCLAHLINGSDLYILIYKEVPIKK